MYLLGSSKRPKPDRGNVGREVYAWMARRIVGTRGFLRSVELRVNRRQLVWGSLTFLALLNVVFLLSSKSPFSAYSAFPNGSNAPQVKSCSRPTKPFIDAHQYCTGECNTECFSRVDNICFATDKVRICGGSRRSDLPKFIRFFGEKRTVPVEWGSGCNEGWHWISGLSLVADQRFLPAGKPNPHHEAEKLIPAVLLKQFINQSASLQWFASKADVSVWGIGFLEAFGLQNKVRFHELPMHKDDSICFKDAVLFSPPTHSRYVPNKETNALLRTEVLRYCGIEEKNSSWPISRAVVLDRASGSRKLDNKLAAGKLMEEVLGVPVEHRSGGIGSFCDQVRSVAEDDFFLVPHGSQNVNFLFARPGAVVIEVFPYLYYTDALRNFTYAAAIDVYTLLGVRHPESTLMPFFSMLGWAGCFNFPRHVCKNYARSQPVQIDLIQLEGLLRVVQKQRSSLRAELGC